MYNCMYKLLAAWFILSSLAAIPNTLITNNAILINDIEVFGLLDIKFQN